MNERIYSEKKRATYGGDPFCERKDGFGPNLLFGPSPAAACASSTAHRTRISPTTSATSTCTCYTACPSAPAPFGRCLLGRHHFIANLAERSVERLDDFLLDPLESLSLAENGSDAFNEVVESLCHARLLSMDQENDHGHGKFLRSAHEIVKGNSHPTRNSAVFDPGPERAHTRQAAGFLRRESNQQSAVSRGSEMSCSRVMTADD